MAVHTVDAGIVIIFFQELSGKGDTDQAVIGIDGFDLVVIEITGMTAKCFGIGMGSNDRFGRSFDNIPEARCSNMGNIYQHAQTVHFCNYLTAKGGQTAAAAFFVDAIGNVVAVAPGKGDSAHAKLIEHAQGFQTAIDSAAFFDSQQSCCFVVEHVGSIGFS